MKRFVVVYGSSTGHTAKIGARLASKLRAAGHDVELFDSDLVPDGLRVSAFDGAIVGGSVRIGKHQKSLVEFVRKHREELARMPNAFFSSSLSAGRDKPSARREVARSIGKFLVQTAWRPQRIETIAGALLYTQYGFFTRLLMLALCALVSAETDTSRDYVHTDWDAVDAFARSFADSVTPAAEARPAPPWAVSTPSSAAAASARRGPPGPDAAHS